MLTFLVADVHLHPSRPETARRFGAFLSGPARGAQALYILGDLFDAWAGDDDLADPFNAGICAALKALTQAGTQTFFLPGNRDFLVGADFAAATGITLLDDEAVVDLGGVPTLLLHGDTLCDADREYQNFRATVRSPQWQSDFLARPLGERKAEIEHLRSRSEREKQTKRISLMDTDEAAMLAAFRRHHVERIIHGHTHRIARHVHNVDGRPCERWVLGDWDRDRRALACDEGGCRILKLQ